ncbi:MAG: hypothetical protein WBN13_07485 [Robiginitalea sp.]|uniref:hypothetical protein n=1 Tax=Robiginitalea sp. TaxID=1902411 RepID=UPI003C78D4C9
MAYSYDFNHTRDFKSDQRDTERQIASTSSPVISRTKVEVIAGSLLMAILLLGSWSLDNLFMTELLAVSCVWGIISLIRLKSQPDNTSYEKR